MRRHRVVLVFIENVASLTTSWRFGQQPEAGTARLSVREKAFSVSTKLLRPRADGLVFGHGMRYLILWHHAHECRLSFRK